MAAAADLKAAAGPCMAIVAKFWLSISYSSHADVSNTYARSIAGVRILLKSCLQLWQHNSTDGEVCSVL